MKTRPTSLSSIRSARNASDRKGYICMSQLHHAFHHGDCCFLAHHAVLLKNRGSHPEDRFFYILGIATTESLKNFEAPGIFVMAFDKKPPVHDSATPSFRFLPESLSAISLTTAESSRIHSHQLCLLSIHMSGMAKVYRNIRRKVRGHKLKTSSSKLQGIRSLFI